MKNALVLLTLLFFILGFGQANVGYTAIDSKMAVIPSESETSTTTIAAYISRNFKSESDRIRAVFYWTASNITYDVIKMQAKSSTTNPHDDIPNTLKLRKGVCSDYAEVFADISRKLGIKTYIISGYTKQNGKIENLSHAWCGAKIDNKWFLFDPTWGSGALNNGKFVKKLNNVYYKVEPSKLITSHIPFDYLWQFSNYPLTNQEFYDGKIADNKGKKQFDFEAEIIKYDKLSEIDEAFESAARIEKNGVLNPMIAEQFKFKKKHFSILTQNKNAEKLNQAFANYNEAVAFLNDFIMYRNKKFKPSLSDDELANMMKNIKDRFRQCEDDIYNIGTVGADNISGVNKLKNLIIAVNQQVATQENFLNEYLGKNVLGRKMMFSNQRMKS